MRVRIEADFALTLFFVFLMNSIQSLLLFFTAAALHEMGHIFFLSVYKIKNTELVLGITGAEIHADMTFVPYKREACVCLGGAGCNIVVCVLCLLFLHFFYSKQVVFFFFANLFYAAANLLPVSGLDGGRALECLLLSKFEMIFARKILFVVSGVSAAGVCVGSFFAFRLFGFNPTLLVLALSLVFQCIFSNPCWRKAS